MDRLTHCDVNNNDATQPHLAEWSPFKHKINSLFCSFRKRKRRSFLLLSQYEPPKHRHRTTYHHCHNKRLINYHRNNNESVTTIMCNECQQEGHAPAASFCEECHRYLCRKAVKYHDRVRLTHSHHLTPLHIHQQQFTPVHKVLDNPDTFELILLWLPPFFLINTAQFVNKYWKDVCNNPFLWNTILKTFQIPCIEYNKPTNDFFINKDQLLAFFRDHFIGILYFY